MERRKRYKLLLFMCCLIFMIAGFYAGYYININYFKNPEINNDSSINKQFTEVEKNNHDSMNSVQNIDHGEIDYTVEGAKNIVEATENRKESKITYDTKIILKEKFLQCNHETTEMLNVSDELLGLTKKEFESIYPKWQVESFNSSEIVLYGEINDKCPSHYLVKQHEGKIAVIYQGSYKKNQIKQIINVNIDQLRQEDKENIIKGINIDSDKELAQFIEDYIS